MSIESPQIMFESVPAERMGTLSYDEILARMNEEIRNYLRDGCWSVDEIVKSVRLSVLTYAKEPVFIKDDMIRSMANVLSGVHTDFKTTTPLSEAYLGEMLAHYVKDKFAYCEYLQKYIEWNGRIWAECDKSKIINIAGNLVKSRLRGATEKKEAAFFLKSLTLSQFQNMSKLANSQILMNIHDFDADKTLINLANGVFDIENKKLMKHDSKYQMTKMCNFRYDEKAKCSNWLTFIDMIFDGNRELINFVQRAIGYCLTSGTGIPAFFVCYGTGANGKSTFMDTIQHMMSDYYSKLPSASLMEKQGDSIPHDIAGLRGTRFVVSSETKVGRPIDEARIKELTGEQTIQVRQLYKELFSMRITFKLWLMSNNKPSIKSIDEGTWRRILLIPFKHCIEEDKRIIDYQQKYLYKEIAGIFNWCVGGYHNLMKDGFNPPEIVRAATNEYRREEDFIGDWIDEYCEVGEHCEVRTTELFDHFRKTTKTKMQKKRFVNYLKEHGFDYSPGYGNYNFWHGISKKEESYADDKAPY